MRPPGDQPQAIEKLVEGLERGPRAPDAARGHRERQDIHRRGRDRARAAPDDGAGPQQDPRRAALRRVPRVLPAQRGRVLRLLLRLLPARSLRAVLATPISRRTPRSTSTSSRCASRPPRRCSSGPTPSSSPPSPRSTDSATRRPTSSMVLHLVRGEPHRSAHGCCGAWRTCSTRATSWTCTQGTYRVRGDVIDIFPAESEREAVRVELFDELDRDPHAVRSAHRRQSTRRCRASRSTRARTT